MKRKPSNPLPSELQAEVDALTAKPDQQIDTSDTAEVEDWTYARRGLFSRPIKKQITLRLDTDLID